MSMHNEISNNLIFKKSLILTIMVQTNIMYIMQLRTNPKNQ